MQSDHLTPQRLIAIGSGVIKDEAHALQMLGASLEESFATAVELLVEATGRVIVSGMGKSGHIGRKIAATLSSIGKPAHFVHPAEASHGDLGMLTSGDAAIILSNSGETAELSHLFLHTQRCQIPVIAISAAAESTLARRSSAAIILPCRDEACGDGIVPTTSTAMMLAVGDALAVSVMKATAFSPEQFRDFHPGGKLGARLSRVRDLMHVGDAVPLASDATEMREVLLLMTRKGFGVAGIVNRSCHLVGIITDGDLRRHMDCLLSSRAADVMTPDPVTIAPDSLAEHAVAVMNEEKITCLFACEPEQRDVQGILHLHDCLRAGFSL